MRTGMTTPMLTLPVQAPMLMLPVQAPMLMLPVRAETTTTERITEIPTR